MQPKSWPKPQADHIIKGKSVEIYPVNIQRHLEHLFRAACIQTNGEDIFKYNLSSGPFLEIDQFRAYLEKKLDNPTNQPFAVYSKRLKEFVGAFSLHEFSMQYGHIEIGSIWYTKKAQRTEINTEVLYLAMCYVFDELHYRRLQWRCNAENKNSRRAAERVGFCFEGIFRNHYWDKGKNRDTAWYSIIEEEWPGVKRNFEENLLRRNIILKNN